VLFVGSGWERKGLRFAINAVEAAADPHLRLLVAGKGNETRYRSPAVQFVGVADDLPALFAAGDIFLLPTIYDPFSNASLEALAAGLPVITTRSNGFAEIMRPEVDGTVIEVPDDVRAITAALLRWCDPAPA
jgi:UDP-glucose:(heptosyl)LPS alpha-1,3-glucosyltransferase